MYNFLWVHTLNNIHASMHVAIFVIFSIEKQQNLLLTYWSQINCTAKIIPVTLFIDFASTQRKRE